MAVPTVNVTVQVDDSGGSPVQGATVTARLNRTEVYSGYVVPEFVTGTTDATGQCILALWPNALGSTESSYDVAITDPDTGITTSFKATIPNNDCTMSDVASLPPYPGKPDGQIAADQAGAAKDAAVAARDAAQTSEANAATSEANAAGSASAASTSEANAAASEASAANSATAASTSEQNAAASESAASTSEANASTSEGNAAGSATESQHWADYAVDTLVPEGNGVDQYSAKHHASKASGSASAAATSAQNAATSEQNAAASEANAATSEQNAAASASAASTSEANAASSETNAATSEQDALNHLADFRSRYYGAYASAPATDPNGNAINAGDLYWDTTTSSMKSYDGTTWVEVGSSTASFYEFTPTDGQTVFSGADDSGLVLAYTPGFISVHLNGAQLASADYTATDGTSITLSSAVTSSDIVTVLAFGTFDIANMYTKAEADGKFPVKPAVPVNGNLVSMDASGNMQDAGFSGTLLAEYEVTGAAVTSIDFTGLDINAHKSYRIELDLVSGTGSNGNVSAYINGDTTDANYYFQYVQGDGGSAIAARGAGPKIGYVYGGDVSVIVAWVQLVDGYMFAETRDTQGAPSALVANIRSIRKTATVSNITQITLAGQVTGMLGVGTKISIYRGDV